MRMALPKTDKQDNNCNHTIRVTCACLLCRNVRDHEPAGRIVRYLSRSSPLFTSNSPHQHPDLCCRREWVRLLRFPQLALYEHLWPAGDNTSYLPNRSGNASAPCGSACISCAKGQGRRPKQKRPRGDHGGQQEDKRPGDSPPRHSETA